MSSLDHLRQWVGKTETRMDTVTAAPIDALAATLDRNARPCKAGDGLPPLWHWLYFLPRPRASELGSDGHVRRGGFLPPVALPRRMWAGGRLCFEQPLRVGEAVERHSTVEDIQLKQGKSGALVFVRVRHLIQGALGGEVTEEHDIVYRERPDPGAPKAPSRAAPAEAQWSRDITPDPVLLFRYSALTFNGHRIHYDRSYCLEQEGYPGLVVHGPLIATLLLEGLRDQHPEAIVRAYDFRAVSPIFDTESLSIHGRIDGDSVRLWALNESGELAMEATAGLSSRMET